MPPLTKTCPKMVLSGSGSLCVKDVFEKKFFGAGKDSAGSALASVRHNLQYSGLVEVLRFNRRAASWRTGFVKGVLDDLTLASPVLRGEGVRSIRRTCAQRR
jgi:hypothetical protein